MQMVCISIRGGGVIRDIVIRITFTLIGVKVAETGSWGLNVKHFYNEFVKYKKNW